MANIKEEFTKVNDYTLQVEQSQERVLNSNASSFSSYRRTFNFLAHQVTTDQVEILYITSPGAGASRVGQQQLVTRTERFDDLPSSLEVQLMHAKMIEMGGKPPALEDVLPNQMFKNKRSAANG